MTQQIAVHKACLPLLPSVLHVVENGYDTRMSPLYFCCGLGSLVKQFGIGH